MPPRSAVRAALEEAATLPEGQRALRLRRTLGDELGERAARALEGSPETREDPSFLATGGALRGPLVERLLGELLDEPERLAPGARLGRLRVERLLGEGGMGAVYEGWDEALERRVAVKALGTRQRLGQQAKSRLRREAQILSRLDHPDICRIHDLVETEGGDFLVLEYVEGETLGAAMARGLPEERRLEVAERLARVLSVAHAERVVHRDVKPENVMLGARGEVKVLDFGIARTASEVDTGETGPGGPPVRRAATLAMTLPGTVVGTPAYMSPEQVRGEETGPASDVFSLGLVLQELFTGRKARPPGPTSVAELLEVAASGRRVEPEGVAPELRDLLAAMTAMAPDARPTAAEVADRIAWHRAGPSRRRRRRATAVSGLAAVLAVAAAAAATWSVTRPVPLLEPGSRARVALLPIVNGTGDASLDWVEGGLVEIVTLGLQRLPGVEVVEPDRLRRLAPAGSAPDLSAVASAVGADVTVSSRIEGKPLELSLTYTTRNVNGETSVRTLSGRDPTDLAGRLAERLGRRLRPEAPPVDVRDHLADDPALNHVYALGLDRWLRVGQAAARPYFAVCLDQDPTFAWAELRLALCEMKAGEHAAARGRAERLAAHASNRHDPALERGAAMVLGQVELERGDAARARQRLDDALCLARQHGNRSDELRALNFLALAERSLGELEAAWSHHQEALAIARSVGDVMQAGYLLNNIGLVEWRRKDLDSAGLLFEEALAIGRRTGVPHLEANARNNLAILAHERGQNALAAEHLREALRLDRAAGDRRQVAERCTNLAIALLALGQLAEAEPRLEEAFAAFTQLGLEDSRAFVDRQLAELHVARGDAARAAPHLARAKPLFAEDLFSLTLLRARARYLEGDFRGAAALARRARSEAGASWTPEAERLSEALRASARAARRLPLPQLSHGGS